MTGIRTVTPPNHVGQTRSYLKAKMEEAGHDRAIIAVSVSGTALMYLTEKIDTDKLIEAMKRGEFDKQ